MKIKRAHSAINADSATSDTISVRRALIAVVVQLGLVEGNGSRLTILALVMAGQPEDRLWNRIFGFVNSTELLTNFLTIHQFMCKIVKMSYYHTTKIH